MYVENYRKQELKEGRERNVYYYNINELTLDCWFEFDHPKTWFDLPDNSIVVIDECQKQDAGFGAMSHMKQQPPCITELETHRHRGFDIFLITQGPHLINSRIKPLVNVHFHLRRVHGWDKAKLYRSDGIIANPENKNNLKDLEVKWFKPDKDFYGVYSSATMHTVKKRLPKVFIYAFLVFIVLLYFIYKSYDLLYLQPKSDKVNQPATAFSLKDKQNSIIPNFNPSSNSRSNIDNFNPLVAYKPRLDNIPDTAPAYDSLKKPKIVPKPNCISSGDVRDARPARTDNAGGHSLRRFIEDYLVYEKTSHNIYYVK